MYFTLKDSMYSSKYKRTSPFYMYYSAIIERVFFPLRLNDIKITSNELDGEIFVVEPDYRDSTLKPKLEEIIRRHSGIVEQNVGDYTSVLIQTKGSILVKNAIKVEACDVIDYKWLLNCDKGQFHAARYYNECTCIPKCTCVCLIIVG